MLVDNYDSFTYNLVHLVKQCADVEIDVLRNDEVAESQPAQYDKIIFSPGPGIPSEAGNMLAIIKAYAGKKPMLGVCLGHQAIGEVFGSELKNLSTVYHGIATDVQITDTNDYLFKDVPSTFKIGRYHSWVVDENKLSPDLVVTAKDENGLIMALSHKSYDIKGVQFHPESVLTEHSHQLMSNWLKH